MSDVDTEEVDATTRAIRAIKAQALREAAAEIDPAKPSPFGLTSTGHFADAFDAGVEDTKAALLARADRLDGADHG